MKRFSARTKENSSKTGIDETYDAERSLLILTDIVCYMKQETKCAFDRHGIKK